MFEHHRQPLLPRVEFLRRQARFTAVAAVIVAGSLLLGVLGYHTFEGLPWIDALLNAAMLLGGMGPVNELHTTAGKLFASFYALYAGLVVLVVAGVFFAPIFHRLLHHFHLDIDEGGAGQESSSQPDQS